MSTSFKGWFQRAEGKLPKPTSSKLLRKGLSKRLKANQQSGRYIHIMDNDMFDTIQHMFKSKNINDKRMAKSIVWNSKLNEEQINYFVTYHPYSLL